MSHARALDAFLSSRLAVAFDWQDHHCCHFAGAWVRQITGRDVLTGLAACAGPMELRRWAKREGGMAAIVTRSLGAQPCAATMAQVGDVVMLPGDITGGMLGICAGRTAALLAAPGVIVHMPMTEAVCAWPLREVAA